MMREAVYGSRTWRWGWVITLFVVAAGLRAGWVSLKYTGQQSPIHEYPDEKAYWDASRSLAAGKGLVDEFGYRATYMPGYPAFLAMFPGGGNSPANSGLYWARLIQAILGALAAPGAYVLAARWLSLAGAESEHAGSGGTAPFLAGLAVACDPFLVFFSGLLLTETLTTTCLVAAWACVIPLCQRGRRVRATGIVAAALMLWLCLMLRPSSAILVVMACAAVILARRLDRQGLLAGAAILILPTIGLIPWAARNYQVIGQWRWLTTRGGISLYDGFQPNATGASDLAHTKTMPEVQGCGEIEWDRFFRQQALSAIRDDPGRAARLAWAKFGRTWNPWPNVENYRGGATGTIGALWTCLMLVFAAYGWWRCRRALAAWIVLLLPVAAFTLLHMVYVGSVRYRLPVMPLLGVLAAVGLVRLTTSLVGRKQPSPPAGRIVD